MDKVWKKYIAKALLLFVLLFVADRGIGYGLKWMYFHQKGEDYFYTTKALDVQTADLVVLGSSRARNHYNPDVMEDSLHMSCYNAGRSGCFLVYQRAQLDLMLDRYTPTTIVLEVTPYDMAVGQSDYDRISGLLPYSHHASWNEVIALKSPWESLKCLSAIYPYNSIFLKMVKNLKDRGEFKVNGFQPLEGQWKQPMADYDIPTPLDECKVDMMRHIIEVCQAKDIKLVMVTSPMYAHAARTATLQRTEELCREYGIQYRSFLNSTGYQDNALFHTSDHLNATGADKFSREIAHWLKGVL